MDINYMFVLKTNCLFSSSLTRFPFLCELLNVKIELGQILFLKSL